MPDTTDLTELHRDALAAVLEHLDLPDAAIDGDDFEQRQQLLANRAWDAAEMIRAVLSFEDEPSLIRVRIERLRLRTSQTPVMYRRYVRVAPDLPADCIICGPGCCSPVLGVHTSCPGPLVGRTVASVR